MTLKEKNISREGIKEYIFESPFTANEISEEIISKLEELNDKLDRILKRGNHEDEWSP